MTDKTIFYYFAPQSPWSYLGHAALFDIAERAGAVIKVRPIELSKVFAVSGGLPLSKRAPQRQAYRLVELKRWSRFLDIPLNLQPKFFPAPGDQASRVIIASINEGVGAALRLALAIMRAVWAEERDIADPDTLRSLIRAQGLAADTLLHHADSALIADTYERYTQEAIDRGVFGVPTYVFRDELFWGQDRLQFLERALGE